MKNKLKNVSTKTWLISSVILIAAIVAVSMHKGVFTSDSVSGTFGALCDSFFVPGALYASFAALTWIGSQGLFDSFSYLFREFALPTLLPGTAPKKYTNLYDYKQAKDEKGRTWFPHLLVLGLIAVAFSLVFLGIYYLTV